MKTTKSSDVSKTTDLAAAAAAPVRVRTGVKAGDSYQWYNNDEETSYRAPAAGSDNPSLRN